VINLLRKYKHKCKHLAQMNHLEAAFFMAARCSLLESHAEVGEFLNARFHSCNVSSCNFYCKITPHEATLHRFSFDSSSIPKAFFM